MNQVRNTPGNCHIKNIFLIFIHLFQVGIMVRKAGDFDRVKLQAFGLVGGGKGDIGLALVAAHVTSATEWDK